MNDEYLWEKTGEDPETMELENALAVFRYREDDPPAVAIHATQQPTRRWRFALGFAIPAFAAAAVAGIIWLPIGNPIQDSDVVFINQTEPPAAEQPAPATNPSPITSPTEQPKQPVRRVEIRPTVASLPRKQMAKTRPQKTVALTDEERYAYHQLMLALSISSSKLNAVRNTINGIENSDNDIKQNNR